MHPILARPLFSWIPTRSLLLVVAMLLGYAAVMAATTCDSSADDEISRVELLD